MTSEEPKRAERDAGALADLRRALREPLSLPRAATAALSADAAHGRGVRRTRPGDHHLQRGLRRRAGADGLCGGPLRSAPHADRRAVPVRHRLRIDRGVPGVRVAARRLGDRRRRQLGLSPRRLFDPRLGDRSRAGGPRLLHSHVRRVLRRCDRADRDASRRHHRGVPRRADLRRAARTRGRRAAAPGARAGPGGKSPRGGGATTRTCRRRRRACCRRRSSA